MFCESPLKQLISAHAFPIDTATQSFTLHLYDTTKAKPTARKRRAAAPGAEPGSSPNATGRPAQMDDEDDEDDFMLGWPGFRRRGIVREDTSLKSIKQVQGIDGGWTVTDCDVDRKGQR